MKFYDARENMDPLKKTQAFKEALRKRCLMKVECEFLIIIWNPIFNDNRDTK